MYIGLRYTYSICAKFGLSAHGLGYYVVLVIWGKLFTCSYSVLKCTYCQRKAVTAVKVKQYWKAPWQWALLIEQRQAAWSWSGRWGVKGAHWTAFPITVTLMKQNLKLLVTMSRGFRCGSIAVRFSCDSFSWILSTLTLSTAENL